MDTDGRPEALETWTKVCDFVDGLRLSVNRDLQREVGLTWAENLVLCHVAMAPDSRLRMVDIAALLGIAKSAVTKTVDRLEQRGLVTRLREPTNKDRRIVYAGLTPEGARVFAAAQPTFVAAVTQQIAAPLTADELHQLGRISEKLLSARARSHEDRSPRNSPVLPRGSAGPGATDGRTDDPIGVPAKGKDPHYAD
jgi:DNA-binding MarR family transcriptional regulator